VISQEGKKKQVKPTTRDFTTAPRLAGVAKSEIVPKVKVNRKYVF
jgi:hypothetical protein